MSGGGAVAAQGERPVLELREVDVAYHGDIRILQGLSMAIRPGRITGVIGPNGAGKSTALRTLYGLLKPVAGDVLVDGDVVTGMPPWRFIERGISLVPQSRSLFNELSVEDNLRLACWSFRRDKARVAESLERAYAQFPVLRERRRHPAGAMSGGQHRARPERQCPSQIYEFIHGLPKQGITVLLVDQNVRQCVRVADHVYVLELGRNKVDGAAGDFAKDVDLRNLIAEWVDYRIDA